MVGVGVWKEQWEGFHSCPFSQWLGRKVTTGCRWAVGGGCKPGSTRLCDRHCLQWSLRTGEEAISLYTECGKLPSGPPCSHWWCLCGEKRVCGCEDFLGSAWEFKNGARRKLAAETSRVPSRQDSQVTCSNCQRKTDLKKENVGFWGSELCLGVYLILFLKRFGFQIGAWAAEMRLNIKHTLPHFRALTLKGAIRQWF